MSTVCLMIYKRFLHLSKAATDGRVIEKVGSTYKTHQINDDEHRVFNDI